MKKLPAILGMLCLLLTLALSREGEFYRAYLYAFTFWFGIAIGCFAILLMHNLTGGAWGLLALPVFTAASKTLWICALLFLPIFSGLHHLYIWTSNAELARNPHLLHQSVYLNVGAYTFRTLFYFSGWLLIAAFFHKRTKTGQPLGGPSAGGLVFYGFSVSWASFDWIMSIQPDWYSTVYGLIFIIGQGLSAMAFALVVLAWVYRDHKHPAEKQGQAFNDLGNLLLTFTMTWAYLSFVQYLIIWSGNLPDENPWFAHRVRGGWGWVSLALIVFQFFAPFFLLLFRSLKRRPLRLGAVAALVLGVKALETLWQIMPDFRVHTSDFLWLDGLALLGVGGLWISAFLFSLANLEHQGFSPEGRPS